MRKRRGLWGVLPLLGMAGVLSGCGKKGVSTLIPLGTVSRDQANLMLFSFLIMVAVVLVVGYLFVYAIVKFRQKKNDPDIIPEQIEGNIKLELAWTIIPIILLIILAFPTISKTFQDSQTAVAKGKNVVHIKVTGHQFWWQFEYPDQKITTAQDLVIPTGKKIVIDLTSKDVIHSFWVPALAGKQDANPNQTSHLWLNADKPGIYKGRCAELCGASHALMYFNVKAVSPSKFKQWVSQMQKGPVAPQTASAKEGQQIFKNNCLQCHAVGDQGGQVGPNLSNFADRENVAGYLSHTKANVKKWITNPSSVKPGALMPAFGQKLSAGQIQSLADYLFSLSVKNR